MPYQAQATLPSSFRSQGAHPSLRRAGATAGGILEIGYLTALLTFYRPRTNKSTVVTILVVMIVELIVDWSGGGAGGPFVSPAMTGAHRALHTTQTNAKAFSVFNIGTSDIVFS
jgi:hypothetical protein